MGRLGSKFCVSACIAVVLLFFAASAGAADPPHYARKAGWFETMLASREAIAQAETQHPPRAHHQS